MSLKADFIHMVRKNEMTDQPDPDCVYFDYDLEVVLSNIGADHDYNIEKGLFVIFRGQEEVAFKYRDHVNRHGADGDESLISLTGDNISGIDDYVEYMNKKGHQ